MKNIRKLVLVGWGWLAALSLWAQEKVPYSYQFQAPAAEEEKLQEITQVSYANTHSMRLFFENVQLGKNSYLLLEGSDGAKQKLNAQALQNWNNSSAYFNGQNVKVSIYQAAGEEVTLQLKELKIVVADQNGQQKARSNTRPKKITTPTLASASTGLYSPPSEPIPATGPYTDAIGRFTNGSNSLGTGWIAANGAIVTTRENVQRIINHGYDIIEFNVPLSNEDGSVNHPAPEDQYPVIADVKYLDNATLAQFVFKHKYAPHDSRIMSWAIAEALPNGTGMRPGERQQQYFQVVNNPGSFAINAMDDKQLTTAGIYVDVLHYGDYPEDAIEKEGYRTLRRTTTKLYPPKELISKHAHPPGYFGSNRELDVEHILVYNMVDWGGDFPSSSASGAPIVYHESNVAIGIHTTSVHAGGLDEESIVLTGAIGFKNDYLRNALSNFIKDAIYVDAEGLYDDGANGQIDKPYLTVSEGVQQAAEHDILSIARGSYDESVTIDKPLKLSAPVGKVVIGASSSANHRSARPIIPFDLYEDDPSNVLSDEYSLLKEQSSLQSFPNPFTHQTELHYTLKEDSPVQVKVYDLMGQEVQTLVEEEQLKGAHHLHWDGHNQLGKMTPNGLYIIQLNTGEETSTVRVIKQ
ncbi:MAG: T9SS type A sorting domain-containing protein [Cyclobacteriaceae bacterium]